MVAMAIEFRVQVCMLFTLSHEFLKGGRGGRERRGEESRAGSRRGKRKEGEERGGGSVGERMREC